MKIMEKIKEQDTYVEVVIKNLSQLYIMVQWFSQLDGIHQQKDAK